MSRTPPKLSAEHQRLNANALQKIPLEKWGPYLSERQWGTVREDYSEHGDAWNYFTHDHARSRAYRWGEDGIAGICDYLQNICFSVAFWNGNDAILKERLFGLTNHEGNHGEDVKELYYYLDNVPSHYYMQYLYKYPHAAYPYEQLLTKNANLSKQDPEFEILDSGVFNDNKYFDVFIEYAKNTSEDIYIKIRMVNKGSDRQLITILPTTWFYNRWQYGGLKSKPSIVNEGKDVVSISHERTGNYFLYFQTPDDLLFTENETNFQKISGKPNESIFVKDAFHDAIINQTNIESLRNKKEGTKCSQVYKRDIEGGKSATIYLRLTNEKNSNPFPESFEDIFISRKKEADEFYNSILPKGISEDLAKVQRQAFAGLLWSKQFYHFDVERWLGTSDGISETFQSRGSGRNGSWKNLKNQDVISMPDKWEYPWYAAWDSAFHAISMAKIDPTFAKNQLLILMREWYMNADGQLPAYEWDFSDVNPPVHAFAALEVYTIEKSANGEGDLHFLKKIFQKLMINFTWWVNRKDVKGNNIFEGGFLGLDNIAIFNRSMELPGNVLLEQTDGTSWMGMYALNMMDIALEIAMHDDSFEDAATKFYEHFVIIAEALNELGLWNEEDNFFYDVLSINGGDMYPLKVRSVIGLVPLFAVSVIHKNKIDKLEDFKKRMLWFRNYRINNNKYLPSEDICGNENILLSLVHKERLILLLEVFLDESEFLSVGGIRALSARYRNNPVSISLSGEEHTIQYDPADSTSGIFGGNSNWRGPVWMPINYLFIRSLQKYGEFYGESLKVEFPVGSNHLLNLKEVSIQLTARLNSIFLKNKDGKRPVFGDYNWFYEDDSDLVLFHEYFHGDTARGLGASHQTGWTALIAALGGEL